MPTDQHYKILFVSSELHPFAKTGGLGDVSGSLPKALSALDQDVRILIPAYHFAIQKATQLNYIAQISITPLALAGTSTKIDKISIL